MSPPLPPFPSLGPACWLWDYLRRSKLSGFFLPLSGGIDSSSTASLVGSMCDLVMEAIAKGNQRVVSDLRLVLKRGEGDTLPKDAKELAG